MLFDFINKFKELLTEHNINLTKRQLLSLSAQLYDPAGTLIGFPIFLFKHIFHTLVTTNPTLKWDEELPDKYVAWIEKALEVFFVSLE